MDSSSAAEIPGLQSVSSSTDNSDTVNTLRKTEELLFSALHENEGLQTQILTLRVKNGLLTNRLCDLQMLADALKSLVDDVVKDTE